MAVSDSCFGRNIAILQLHKAGALDELFSWSRPSFVRRLRTQTMKKKRTGDAPPPISYSREGAVEEPNYEYKTAKGCIPGMGCISANSSFVI